MSVSDERMEFLAKHGRGMLGHLLTLVESASTLRLDFGRTFQALPDLVAPVLNDLRRCKRVQKGNVKLELFDASAAQVVFAIPNLRLDELHLCQERIRPLIWSTYTPENDVPAALNRELLQVPRLEMSDFNMWTVHSGCWDLLAANRTLQELRLTGEMGFDVVVHIAAALTRNTTLRFLHVGDIKFQGRLGVFEEALAVNASLEEFSFMGGAVTSNRKYTTFRWD